VEKIDNTDKNINKKVKKSFAQRGWQTPTDRLHVPLHASTSARMETNVSGRGIDNVEAGACSPTQTT
jgi:hypothetical protein